VWFTPRPCTSSIASLHISDVLSESRPQDFALRPAEWTHAQPQQRIDHFDLVTARPRGPTQSGTVSAQPYNIYRLGARAEFRVSFDPLRSPRSGIDDTHVERRRKNR
jgi:hypothetical protein